MATYNKITDFASKDALLTGNPSKIVKGTEIGAEFDAIAVADASNVKGPTSAVTDNAVVRWDTTTGRIAQGSGVTIDDSNVVTASGFSGPLTGNVTGNVTGNTIGAHNGTVGATTPASGAFTTLSATSGITNTGGQIVQNATIPAGTSSVQVVGAAGAARDIAVFGQSGYSNGFTIKYTGSNMLYTFNDSGAAVATISSTGLAVTGALSATGNINLNGGAFQINDGSAVNKGQIGWQSFASNVVGVGTTGAYNLVFATNSAVQATLDTSGNLGLGVTPSAWGSGIKSLDVNGSSFASSTATMDVAQNAYYNGAGWIYKNTATAQRYTQSGGVHYWYTATSGTAGTAITFTQAMTLDASGNLLVGVASSGFNNSNSIELLAGAANTGNVVVNHLNGSSSGNAYASFAYNGTGIGSITQSGTTAVLYNTTSDHRLKTNVRPSNAARFMDIQFRDFEWVDGRHDCGVIAHELQAVYPDLVLGEKDATEVRTVEIEPAVPAVLDADGNVVTPEVPAVTEEQTFPVYQQVNYMGLIGRMGTVIQQQQKQLEAQQTLIDSMELRLAALEAK